GEVADLTTKLPHSGQAAHRNGNFLEICDRHSRLFRGGAERFGDLGLDRRMPGACLQSTQLCDRRLARRARESPEARVTNLRCAWTDAGKLLEARIRRTAEGRWQRIVIDESAAPHESAQEVGVRFV